MAITIDVVRDTEALMVEVTISGLVVGTRYDVMRLQQRFIGDDPETNEPIYERETPDRAQLWSSVAHRVAWLAPKATVTFRDYETPLRPTSWFVVESSKIGPLEHDWETGDYPVTRGVLDTDVVHFQREIELASAEPGRGYLMVRAMHDLARYEMLCVVDIEEIRYTARGTELQVLGSPFPSYVGDVRGASRGSVIFMVDSLGQYDRLRSLMFPASGRLWPVVFNVASGDPTLLLDDLRVIPLDITVEQITPRDANLRYVRVDFVEIAGGAPVPKRSGDNDDLVTAPHANFTVGGGGGDGEVERGDVCVLTSTSTGQFDHVEWQIKPRPSNWRMGVSFAAGPHRVKWESRGTKTIKLRVSGPAGAQTRTKTIVVH